MQMLVRAGPAGTVESSFLGKCESWHVGFISGNKTAFTDARQTASKPKTVVSYFKVVFACGKSGFS